MGARWEHTVLALLDDLEQQADGLAQVERDLEVADRSAAAYAQVALAARVHALDGCPVRLRLLGGLVLAGSVRSTGADFLLLDDEQGREWVVPHAAVGVVHQAPARAVVDAATGVLRRLSLRAVLRRVASDDPGCVLHLRDGARHEATLIRLGADFVEVSLDGSPGGSGLDLVPFAAIAAVQRRG